MEEVAVELFNQMALAVRHLHQSGISHRDLKADNFLIERGESTLNLKLIDFGLSQYFEDVVT